MTSIVVGHDDREAGRVRVRDGRAEFLADTAAGRGALEALFDRHAAALAERPGQDPAALTAADVLGYMVARMRGRTWAHPAPARESKDASGHEHASDGKFTGLGAGGGGGSPDPKAGHAGRQADRDRRRDAATAARVHARDAAPSLMPGWDADLASPDDYAAAAAGHAEALDGHAASVRGRLAAAGATERELADFDRVAARQRSALARHRGRLLAAAGKAHADLAAARQAADAHDATRAALDAREPVIDDGGDEAAWGRDHAAWEAEVGRHDRMADRLADRLADAEDAWQDVGYDYLAEHDGPFDAIHDAAGDAEDAIHDRVADEDDDDPEPEDGGEEGADDDGGGPGPGRGPARESKDASGHEHASDGKFSAAGGGGKGKGKKGAAKAGPDHLAHPDLAQARKAVAQAETPEDAARALARFHAYHHRRGHREHVAALEREMARHGAVPVGVEGETVPFDGRVHEAEVGVSDGQPVTVTRKGFVHETNPDGEPVARARVEPAAAADPPPGEVPFDPDDEWPGDRR